MKPTNSHQTCNRIYAKFWQLSQNQITYSVCPETEREYYLFYRYIPQKPTVVPNTPYLQAHQCPQNVSAIVNCNIVSITGKVGKK